MGVSVLTGPDESVTGNACSWRSLDKTHSFMGKRLAFMKKDSDRQTISFIEISIEAGKLLGGKHEACFVLGVAGIEPMRS